MDLLLPTISTLCIVISAIFVAIGWYYIKARKTEDHRKMMLTAAWFAVAFFVIYFSRTAFIGNTSFGGPENIKIYYTIFLIFHILLSTTSGVLGVFMIRWGLKNRLDKHRKFGPMTSVLWFCTAITGLLVYLLLYVFFPGGETTSLIKAIFGF